MLNRQFDLRSSGGKVGVSCRTSCWKLSRICWNSWKFVSMLNVRSHLLCIEFTAPAYIYKYMFQRFNGRELFHQLYFNYTSIIPVKLETEFVGCHFSDFLNFSKHWFDRQYDKMLYFPQIALVCAKL